jgi:putative transposase
VSSGCRVPCQFTSIRFGARLAEICAAPSIESVGDSYDTALAESVHNLYRRELVKARGPCKTINDLELATLGCVTWFDRERLHGTFDDVPPVEHEAAFSAAATRSHEPVGIQ